MAPFYIQYTLDYELLYHQFLGFNLRSSLDSHKIDSRGIARNIESS